MVTEHTGRYVLGGISIEKLAELVKSHFFLHF